MPKVTPSPSVAQEPDYTASERDNELDTRDAELAEGALSSPARPTPKEVHLMDVYDSLGVQWGDDVFAAIAQLKAVSSPARPQLEQLRKVIVAFKDGTRGGNKREVETIIKTLSVVLAEIDRLSGASSTAPPAGEPPTVPGTLPF